MSLLNVVEMATLHTLCRRSSFGLLGIAKIRTSTPTSGRLPNTTRHALLRLERTKWKSFTTAKNGPPKEKESMTMWQRFLAPKPMPERHTFAWYREMLLVCTVRRLSFVCFVAFFRSLFHPLTLPRCLLLPALPR